MSLLLTQLLILKFCCIQTIMTLPTNQWHKYSPLDKEYYWYTDCVSAQSNMAYMINKCIDIGGTTMASIPSSDIVTWFKNELIIKDSNASRCATNVAFGGIETGYFNAKWQWLNGDIWTGNHINWYSGCGDQGAPRLFGGPAYLLYMRYPTKWFCDASTEQSYSIICERDFIPTSSPSSDPSISPTNQPTNTPTNTPTLSPSTYPSEDPSTVPTLHPTTDSPSKSPTTVPSSDPSYAPSISPSESPSIDLTQHPSSTMTGSSTFDRPELPSTNPIVAPTSDPTSDSIGLTESSATLPPNTETETNTKDLKGVYLIFIVVGIVGIVIAGPTILYMLFSGKLQKRKDRLSTMDANDVDIAVEIHADYAMCNSNSGKKNIDDQTPIPIIQRINENDRDHGKSIDVDEINICDIDIENETDPSSSDEDIIMKDVTIGDVDIIVEEGRDGIDEDAAGETHANTADNHEPA